MKYKLILFLICLVSFAHADVAIQNGKVVDAETLPTTTMENHTKMGIEAYNKKNWEETIKQFKIVTRNFPNSNCAKDGYYNLGVAYYYESEFEEANNAFTNYLKHNKHPEHFEGAMRYKLAIANAFSLGAKRRMFGVRQMPKWLYAYELCLDIYDEIISTMPSHDLAAQALYSKGTYYWRNKEYRDSVETFQLLTKKFPKHPLAVEGYSHINKIYAEQSQKEFQNPDIIAFAELNAKKFGNDFPGEERVLDSEMDVKRIKETYAKGLYETGRYYEKTKQKDASVIYYRSAINQFPETAVSNLCRKRLMAMNVEEIPQ